MTDDARTAQAARRKLVAGLVADWDARQRPKIEEARGPIITAACRYEVERLAAARDSGRAPVILTLDQIQICEDRAVSSARNMAYGPYSLRRNDEGASWRQEMEITRAELRAGRRPATVEGVDQPMAPKPETSKRLAELAKAHREGVEVASPQTASHPSRPASEEGA